MTHIPPHHRAASFDTYEDMMKTPSFSKIQRACSPVDSTGRSDDDGSSSDDDGSFNDSYVC